MNQQRSIKMILSGAFSIFMMITLPTLASTKMNSDNKLTVSTQLGQIKGKLNDGIATFYGVPYAKNPFVEGRRFQAPQAIASWNGVLDSSTIKPPVPQPSRGPNTTLVGSTGDLTINIWSTEEAITTKQKRPVMVWLPGGAFIREDASEGGYNGTSFAKNGVVIVTVNYRVGVDGFMHLKGAPDNRGILDQILALQWVQANIDKFGGDPKQVTLFGQSAGAESVAILLGTKQANGLYQKAIIQSPPMQSVTQNEAQRISSAFANKLKVPATIEGISTVPYPQLVKTVIEMGKELTNRKEWAMLSWGGTAFLPVIDKTLIADTPMANLANNVDPSIPVIVGSTDQEARLYLVPSGEVDRISHDQVTLLLGDLALNGEPESVYSQAQKRGAYGEIFADIQSDYTFRMPALHIAEQLTKNGNKVWKYNFYWKSSAFNGRLGAAHFIDVPFAFNTIDSPAVAAFMGDKPPAPLAKEMHQQWINFAKTGQAGWTTYNKTKRATMRFDVNSIEVDDPNHDLRKLWNNYHF